MSSIDKIRSRWADQPVDGYCSVWINDVFRHVERNTDVNPCINERTSMLPDDHFHPSYYESKYPCHLLAYSSQDIHILLKHIDDQNKAIAGLKAKLKSQ